MKLMFLFIISVKINCKTHWVYGMVLLFIYVFLVIVRLFYLKSYNSCKSFQSIYINIA